jgi:hypothetical protein
MVLYATYRRGTTIGGSASIAELDEEITNDLHLTDEDRANGHTPCRIMTT